MQCEATGRGLWASHCLRAAYEQILRSCPHLLGPVLGLGEQSPSSIPPTVPADQWGGLVELQYGQIASKLRQWKSLEEERLGLLHDLALLLREAGGSSAAVLQAMAEGFELVQSAEEERILAAENNKFQDILMALETDLKSEEVFWKWLLPVSSSSSSAAMTSFMETLQSVEVGLASAAVHGKLPIEVRQKVVEEVDQVFASILPPAPANCVAASNCVDTPWVHELLQYCMETSPLDDELVSRALHEQRENCLKQLQALLENAELRSPFAALQAPPR